MEAAKPTKRQVLTKYKIGTRDQSGKTIYVKTSRNMPFTRKFDASYPCVYSTWKTHDATMIIQDLCPEDDDEALKILRAEMITDEVLCSIQKLSEDPTSVKEIVDYWREILKDRMSLGCYEEKNGKKTLVALNVCMVSCEGEDHVFDFKGEKWRNVYDICVYAEKIGNAYKFTNTKVLLHALGLIVKREYRGHQLGQKILAAREPLCKSQGVTATSTIFTGVGSQKSASRCGFHTIAEFSIGDLAELGYPYPKDDERIIKYMAKKYTFA